MVCLKFLLPWLVDVMPGWGRFFCSLVALILMAPFLLALAMPASKHTERQRLITANAHFDVPLVVMTIFRLLLALSFIIYMLSAVHSMRVGWIVGFLIFIVLIGTWSGRFKKQMRHIESRFFNNLNERELRRSGKNNNLVSDLHLAFIEVGYGCPFVGERLADSDMRKRYGVNVASIQRGASYIAVPNGNVRIFPGDVLGIIGTDSQIEQLLPILEQNNDDAVSANINEVKLTNIQLTDKSPLVGKTSASAQIRDKYKALLVAIQHPDGSYDHPTGSTVFQPEDVLWLVGNRKLLETLK